MATITAKAVADLRAKTGCGMMDCKKALVEAEGNFDEAIKLLREKGLASAAKKADRIAAEGVVSILVDETTKTAAMIEVNSETDFVAKNQSFRDFVNDILKTILENKPADVAELLTCKYLDTDVTVEAELKNKIFTIGENLTIRRFVIVEGDMSTYIHGGGAAGVIVTFDAEPAAAANEGFAEVTKNVALQVAAMNCQYAVRADVPESVINEEKEILKAQIANDPKSANKPAQVIEKMITGRINKFYETNCLEDQAYVKEDSISVGKYLENESKNLGGSVKIKAFYRFEKGEGLEKRDDNFVAEIESMMKKG